MNGLSRLIVGESRETAGSAVAAAADQRYAELFEGTLLGICISTPSGSLMTCNPAFARMLGFSSVDAAIGVNMASLYADTAGRTQFLRDLQRHGRLEHYRAVLRRRDGRLLHVITSVVGQFDADGTLREIRGYLLDDTASVEAERARQEREQLFRAVFDDAVDAMLLLDDRGAILEANGAAAALFGRPVDSLVAESLGGLMVDCGESVAGTWQEFLTVGEAHHEHQFTGALGTRIVDCRYRARVHRERHLCIARDITERRAMDERLAQAARIESVGRLATGIAHDFNNLLTAILGYTELLLTYRAVSDPEREDLQEIQRAGQRAAVLTHQLLAFGRKQLLQPQEVDLNRTINGIQPMLRGALREDIALTIDLAATPAVVMIDANEVEQVILNLILNSRDAVPDGGTIHVDVSNVTMSASDMPVDRVASAGPYVRLRVTDNGSGIPPEIRAHLFEPFFTTKGQGKGTGLGLASVHGIVDQSNGFILVDNAPDGGTIFSLYFPAVAQSITPSRAEMHRGCETILLVEDEQPVRTVIAVLLRRSGYDVVEAATPGEAARLFADCPDAIDVLVTDVVMPQMSGPALAARCRLDRPNLRVLFVSGYGDDVSPAGMPASHVAFLGKPFQAAALAKAVRELLDRPIDRAA